jgi:hypothetical protein
MLIQVGCMPLLDAVSSFDSMVYRDVLLKLRQELSDYISSSFGWHKSLNFRCQIFDDLVRGMLV